MNEWTAIWKAGTEESIKANQAIDAIVSDIDKVAESQNHGTSGFCNSEAALLMYYVGMARGDMAALERACELLNRASEVAHRRRSLSLFGGLAGVGWTVQHIAALLEEDTALEADDPGCDLDVTMLRGVAQRRHGGYFDLIDGLVGYGTYFLERLPRKTAVAGISAVVDELSRLADYSGVGVSWHTGPELLPDWQRQANPQGYHNLGLAHGVPAVIHFLSEAVFAGVSVHRALPLLEGAMQWLMAQESPPGSLSRFGWFAGSSAGPSRLGWCYGDLGIVSVVDQVGRRSGRAQWQTYSRKILDHCLARGADASMVVDAGLCHGACGVGHMYNRLFHYTGDLRCKESAREWLAKALAMRQPGQGIGGFYAVKMGTQDTPPENFPSPTLLEGAVGVGLALVAAIAPQHPSWDRLLLLSGKSVPAASGVLDVDYVNEVVTA